MEEPLVSQIREESIDAFHFKREPRDKEKLT
jgi:hypothetical protein